MPFFIEFNEVSKYVQLDPVGIVQVVYLSYMNRQRVHKFGYSDQRSVIVFFCADCSDSCHDYTSSASIRS